MLKVPKPAAAGLQCLVHRWATLSSAGLVRRFRRVADAVVSGGGTTRDSAAPALLQPDGGGFRSREKVAGIVVQQSGSPEDEHEHQVESSSSSKYYQTERVQERMQFLRELGLSDAQLEQLQSHSTASVRSALLQNSVEKLTTVATFLTEEVGLSKAQVAACLFGSPYLGGSSVDVSLRPKVQYFLQLGFTKEQVGKFILSYPQVLGCKMERTVLPMTRKLLEIGLKDEDIVKAYMKRPSLATVGIARVNKIDEIVHFMRSFGVDVQKWTVRYPQIFTQNLEGKIFQTAEYFKNELELDDLQLRSLFKWPIVFSYSVEDNLRVKVDYLRSLGISKDGIARIVAVHPPIFALNLELSIKPKAEFLLTVLEKNVSDLVQFPQYLSYSLSKRIKPRYEYAIAAGSDFKSLGYYLACGDEKFRSRCKNRVLRLKSIQEDSRNQRCDRLEAASAPQ